MRFESIAFVFLMMFLAVACAIAYGVVAWTMGDVAARKQLPGLFVAGAIAAAIMSGVLFLPSARLDTIMGVVQLAVVLIVLPATLYQLQKVAQAGAVLLDLGRMRGYRFYMVVFALQIVAGLAMLVASLWSGPLEWRELTQSFFMIAIGLQFVSVMRQRVQLREQGLVYGYLIPWAKVKGYQWEPADPSVLTLRVRNLLGFTMRMSFPVPPELVARADQVLAQHVQVMAPA